MRSKEPKTTKYKGYFTKLSEAFPSVPFNYLLSSKNHFADTLETLSSVSKISEEIDLCPIVVETRDQPVYCDNIEANQTVILGTTISGHSLRDNYPKSTNAADKRTLRKLACHFFVNGEVISKRSDDGVLLRCVDAPQANKIMSKIQKGHPNPTWADSCWPGNLEDG